MFITNFSDIDETKIKSETLIEYLAFKKQNPDSIILIQIGTFFEAFCEDAKILCETCNISASSRPIKGIGQVLQSGIPINSINFYIKLLINNNYKVCICPQFSENGQEYHRKLVRKYTKGTVIENEFLESGENNYILALYKKDEKYYLSYADVSTGQFYKTNTTNYNNIKTEADKISPSELLILNSQANDFKEITIKYNTTYLYNQNSEILDNDIEDIIIKYCKETQKNYAVKLNEVIEYKINQYLMMDELTRINLELTRTKRLLKKKGSILWFLNYTKTPMGTRLLKKILSEPLLDVGLIKERQKAIKELLDSKDNLKKLEEIMEKFCDLSRICAKISNSTILPKNLFILAESLKTIETLDIITKNYSSKYIKINSLYLKQLQNLVEEINSAILRNASEDLKSGGIIKEGYDSNLDFLREQNLNIENDILKYEQQEIKTKNIDKLKIKYNAILGYFIEIPSSKQSLIPGNYVKVQALAHTIRYTTSTLKEFESKKSEIQYKINQLEYEIYCKIRNNAKSVVSIIRKLSDDIAKVDVFVSLSKCAIINNLTCPVFNDNGIYIQNGFHPSLLKLNNLLVKNDTNLDNSKMLIITGANMGGKSTYIKQNAIICLLSQIGSFVPADEANVKIIDKLFLRQGTSDDIVNNNSSFMVEMNDFKYILDNADIDSLVLLDEPAKSTNSKEGGAIARAYLEYFSKHIKAKTIVVTHNFELTKIENNYPDKVENWQIGFNQGCMDRKLKKGISKTSNAIDTAILAQLPKEITDKAKEYI